MVRWFISVVALSLLTAVAWGEDAKPVSPDSGPKITYEDHIRGIFREHCFACHALDRAKGGLTLDTYAKTMTGGSSGEVVLAGDPDSSRLWGLVSHLEEPAMPPMQDKLAEAKLDLIKKWIEQGALENAGSKASVKKKPGLELAAPSNLGKPEGPAAMPENLLCQPVVYTSRPGQITALATSPWAPLMAVGGQKQVVLYNTDSGNLLGVLPFPEGIPFVVRFSRNGSVLLVGGGHGGQSGCVALFDVKSGKRLAKIGDELDVVLAADITPDLQKVAMSGPGKIVRVYSVASGELLHEMKKHTDWVYGCEYSPDGVLLATSDRSAGLFVWEADTGREYLDLRGHSSGIPDVAWRGDSNMLASAGEDGTVRLWELNDGKQVKQWTAHGGGTFCVTYAHDGRLCTAGRDNAVKSWTADGAAIKTYPGFVEQALQCAFTHDGNMVIGGDWLGSIKAWSTAEGKEVAAFSPNPQFLADQLAAAQQAVAPLQAPAEQAKQELATAEKLLADRTVLAQAAMAKQKAAEVEPAKAEGALNEAKKAGEPLAEVVKATQAKLAGLDVELKAIGDDKPDEKVAKELQVTQAKEELAQAEAKVAEHAKLVEALAAALKQAQDAVPVATAEAAQKEKERMEAEAQIAAKKSAAEASQAALAAAQLRVQQVESQLKAFEALPVQLSQAVAEAQKKLDPLKQTREKLAAEHTALMSEIPPKDAAIAEMNAKIAALQAELAKLEEAKKAVAATAASKQNELNQVEGTLAEAEGEVATAVANQQAFAEAYGKK